MKAVYFKYISGTISVILFIIGYIYINFNAFKHRTHFADFQIWSHRGVHESVPENSPESLQSAKDHGFSGVEIDVFYDKTIGLVVSHDYPYKLIDHKILTLNEVLDQFGTQFNYWIDLKNLDRKNVDLIIGAFNELFEKNKTLRQHVFIESASPALRRMSYKNINCIYWVQYSKKNPKQWLKLLYIKSIIGHSNFVGITTHYRYIDQEFSKVFKNVDWYIFTVNDPLIIARLKMYPESKVILTDLNGMDVFK